MRPARVLGCGVLALSWACSAVDAADPPAKPDEAAVQQALRELDHAEWSVRERATQTLQQSGAAAVKTIAQRAATGSPEAAVRATEVLAAFYADLEFPAVDVLENELESLILARGSVGEAARRAWEGRRSDREQRALARIQEFGGTIQYPQSTTRLEPLEDQPTGIRAIDSVVLTRRWKGGDDGLRYVRRLTIFGDRKLVYRVKGSPVSDAAIEQLEQAGFHIEPRGARLGIGNTTSFGPDVEGCVVGFVKEDSPASKAGLLERDVIVKFNEKAVADFQDLIEILKEIEPGQTALVTIRRGDEVKNLPVILDDW